MAAIDTVTADFRRGQQIDSGIVRSVITSSATHLLKTGSGKVGHIAVWDVGTTWTIDVYDNTSAANKVWGWVSADGKGVFPIQMPMATGITVVTGGTAGGCTVVWS